MLDPASQTRSPDTGAALSRRHSTLSAAEQPDLLLIERARGGSEQATEALIRRYARRLFRVARTVILDDMHAEAVVQEACVAAFADLSRYEPTGKFAAWLTRLTYQHARSVRHPDWLSQVPPLPRPCPRKPGSCRNAASLRMPSSNCRRYSAPYSSCVSSRASAGSKALPPSACTKPRYAPGSTGRTAGWMLT